MTYAARPAIPTELDLEAFSHLVYAMRHRVSSPRPGNHASRSPGPFGRFQGLSLLAGDNDARRIDLKASITDPFEEIRIRRFAQPSNGTVWILVDLSGSMGFEGTVSRHAVAVALAAGLAEAVRRAGDKVGIVAACGDAAPVFELQPTRRASAPLEVATSLAAVQPSGAGLEGLAKCAASLPASPSLVFVVSDFAAPLGEIGTLLDALALHDVRPLVVADPDAEMPNRRFGLVHLDDLEGAGRGLIFLRPLLLATWRRERTARRQALFRLFVQTGCQPLQVTGQIDLRSLSEDLLSGTVAA
ncbi:DUF58 domain-containing protein [Fulvimarina endophytica]|uniref:DUF58 domain-containing protein n=1 Tax=Fulvimarina endophytica TaxID=2293836 RepID=A0A371X2R5_9HYPH|nr:DUF58 domain-containing protein [Fulvimarina endophytica]RFC63520.1 DUF58 domain-containing protein [Fulvimarina endophytica]